MKGGAGSVGRRYERVRGATRKQEAAEAVQKEQAEGGTQKKNTATTQHWRRGWPAGKRQAGRGQAAARKRGGESQMEKTET